MGQYFKAYSPARKSIANMTYSRNYDLEHLKNVPYYSPEEMGEVFDDIELKMGAEFGEYALVGEYGTIVYRTGDEQNPSYSMEDDKYGFTKLVWNPED